MTVRSTMSALIEKTRGLTNTQTGDGTVEYAAYWSSQQIQDVLDRHRSDIYRQPIAPIQTYEGGTVVYKNYPFGIQHLEQTSGGTAIFYVQGGDNTTVGTASYAIDYNRGEITFNSDTSGSVYYLYARAYDIDAAAAEIWRMKAAQVADSFDFSTDNHSVKKSQVYEHCLKMANYYEQRSGAGVNVTQMYRSDLYPYVD